MLRTYSAFFFLLWSFYAGAQQPLQVPLNSSTVFRDARGQLISFDTFLEYTSGKDYEMNPVFDENNELKEVIVARASIAGPTTDPSQFSNTVELIDHIPPDFAGWDLQGNFYDTENLIGKVVVLKFWFRACKPCLDEIPELNQLVADYRQNPGVVFLAPSLDKEEAILDFLQQQPFSYAIIPDARDIAHAYNVPGYPTHVVIGRTGKVKAVYMGVNYQLRKKLSQAIEYALYHADDPVSVAPSVETEPLAAEEELFISPESVIKRKTGEVVPFAQFVALMQSQQYELLSQKDSLGNAFILMQEITTKADKN